MMEITLHECKKAFRSPIFIVLILLFSAFNIFLIISDSYYAEELKVTNEIANKYGVQITEESLLQLEQDLKQELLSLNKITKQRTGQEFSSIDDLWEMVETRDYDRYSEEERDLIKQLLLKDMLFGMAQSIDDRYDDLDWKRVAESEIQMYGLRGEAAETLKKEYDKFSQRFAEMKASAEHKEWFFPGAPYKMHSLLFGSVFRTIIFESLILIVLVTALITNFEFENKTYLVTFSTFRGRSLMKDKLAASLFMTTVITTIILVVTLTTYFTVFDYSDLWGTSISSAFNWESSLPYVAWWDLSIASFLLCSILLVYICMLLFATITFFIAVFVKNSYYTFFLFSFFFAVNILVPGFMPTSSNLLFIIGFNLPSLVLNPQNWFMGSGGLILFKHYELITVSVWTVISITSCILAIKRFKKSEIH